MLYSKASGIPCVKCLLWNIPLLTKFALKNCREVVFMRWAVCLHFGTTPILFYLFFNFRVVEACLADFFDMMDWDKPKLLCHMLFICGVQSTSQGLSNIFIDQVYWK